MTQQTHSPHVRRWLWRQILLASLRTRQWRNALRALHNTLRDDPPATWPNGNRAWSDDTKEET